MIVKEEKIKGEKLAKQFVFTFDNNDVKKPQNKPVSIIKIQKHKGI